MARPLDRSIYVQAVEAVNKALKEGAPKTGSALIGPGAVYVAADALGVKRQTMLERIRVARVDHGMEPDWSLHNPSSAIPQPVNIDTVRLQDEVRTLRAALRSMQSDEITRDTVRERLTGIAQVKADPPKWLINPIKKSQAMGVPTLFLSDWHWGERVDPASVAFANEFSMEIANERARRLVETAIHLLFDYFSGAQYDGLVLALGGDMVTGDIHEELTNTNDAPIMPTLLDLFGAMIWVIDRLLERFPNIFIPCVTGNHGRNTKKIQSKERHATSFDWLLYCLLQKHHKNDKRVQFDIPNGPDCLYRIYGHSYLLTHGDQFRGGDGMIGPLGPVTRGRHKKSSRDASIERSWLTMLCGHFHTLMQLPHLIVNGSLKGLDEYAFNSNFSYERPAQALWLTHPKQGITFQLPVYLDEPKKQEKTPWISWV